MESGRLLEDAANLGLPGFTAKDDTAFQGNGCGVFQHRECVGIRQDEQPESFFCEQCRMAAADPFWEIVNSKILHPAKLVPTGGLPLRGPGGISEMQQVADKTFHLTLPQLEVMRKADYQLQVRAVSWSSSVRHQGCCT